MHGIEELVAAGRYLEALRAIRANPIASPNEQLARETLWAELAQYTGCDEEAIAHAQTVLDRKPLDQSLAARCHIAIGEVHRNAGQPGSAIESYRQALLAAQKAKDDRQQGLAELRMLLATADGPGLEAATAYVSTVRRHVARVGDPLVTCALHLYLGLIEAQRGLLDNAREHIRIGRSLLSGSGHHYFHGVAAVDASCLAFSISDLDATEAEARKAMHESAKSGHAALRRAAITNLAHVELARGRFAQAERFFTRAARLSPPAGMVQAGITDGLAQLSLARGDLSGAERILTTALVWTPGTPRGSWYYGLWTCATRATLLIRQQHPDDAVSLLTEALAGARDLADPLLVSSLALLLIEALARMGRAREAARVLASTDTTTWASTIDLLAEFGRVLGLALWADGSTDAGRVWFERGGQALASVGNNASLAHLADGYADSLARQLGMPQARMEREAPIDALPPPPGQVVHRLDACTPLAAPRQDRSATALDRAAAIVESGAYPAVVGHEVMHALFETGCVSRAALAVTRQGRPTEVLSWFGCSWSDAAALVAEPPRLIALGAWQDREYAVAVTVPADAGRLVTLMAVERLASAARFERKARNDERERVALWPIDESVPTEDLVFCSSEMTALVGSARKVAGMSITVLVTGETGTGKEMIARVIHGASQRASRPFLAFNCTAVPKDLADSHLFGHRKGAFTGAVADHAGVIRAAAGGTLYLDEIGDLGLDVQPKLLRFLESGEIQPLGESRPQKVDVRVIASTNRNLDQLVAEGLFRADLFYRLNVVPFRLPPLRERREEVPPLAEHFLGRAAREFGKDRLRLSEETMEYLVLYRWPGNVRQLANEMRRLAAMSEAGAVLMPEHLDPVITAGRRTVPVDRGPLMPTEVVVRLDQPHAALVEHAERAQIRYAMAQCGGRLESAARMLGLSRKGLYLKRQRLGLE
jgi:DNA-binding NtrC family response regulator/tetratricopeptide (TPR) repeat protein